MPIAAALAEFKASLAQCDKLIVSANRVDAAGVHLFSALDRKQITNAAYLNLFVAWESYLEKTMVLFMCGKATLNGKIPKRYVRPRTPAGAQAIIIGSMRFFDYANIDYVRKLIAAYFVEGKPYQPTLDSIMSELADMRTIRNACAHISSSTQRNMDTLALRIFGAPNVGIEPHDMLTRADPRSPGDTVFGAYMKNIIASAELIANG